MQWTESNELKLLLGVLAASNLSIVNVAETISENWPTKSGGDQPTARAIRDRFAKLKKDAKIFNFPAAGSDFVMHKPLKALNIDESNRSPGIKSEVTDYFAATNPPITPLKAKSASSVFQTPPSTQIFKPAARKRKRKQRSSLDDEEEAESSGCETSSEEQMTPAQATTPTKSTRPQRSARKIVSTFSTYLDDNAEEQEGVRHRVETSEDSDADFDLEELRMKEEKEASRGQRRSRR